MDGKQNIKSANKGQIIIVGRIKGKIKNGDKVYRTVLEKLNKDIIQFASKENVKRDISAKIYLKENQNIKLEIEDLESKIKIEVVEETVVSKAQNNGLSKERIEEQLSKTGNTPFEIKQIQILADENIILPISSLNSIRRNALEQLENKLLYSFKRNTKVKLNNQKIINSKQNSEVKVSILLNTIKEEINYTKLTNLDNVYIPFRFFLSNKEKVNEICENFNTYVFLPAITKSNYEKLIENNLGEILNRNIKGIIISNLSHLEILEKYKNKIKGLDIIANYTLNISNNNTIKELEKYKISKYIVSPELEKQSIQDLNSNVLKETIVYGRTLLMTSEYCTIGTLKNCSTQCEKGRYKLKDRMGFEFPIYTDRINCNNLIYNSKITSISWKDLSTDWVRIDILEETLEEIQNITNIHKRGERLEGENYTNGNLNREI